jgi:hypothetical protein
MKKYKITETHTGIASSCGEVEWEAGEIVELEDGTTLSDMGIDSDCTIVID